MKKILVVLCLILFCKINLYAQADPPYPSAAAAILNLDHAEYFISSNTAFGSGTFIPLSTGSGGTITPTISTNSLAPDGYTLYVRVLNKEGKWSVTALKGFSVLLTGDPAYPPAPPAAKILYNGEYFIDGNPAFGSATPIPGFPANQVTISNFNFSASTATLPPGNHTFYLRTQDAWSLTASKQFTVVGTPPANDDCINAIGLTVNAGVTCTTTTAGTTVSATQSLPGCTGTADDDVWYKFTATQNQHEITVTPTAGNGIDDVVFEVFSGTCGALTSLQCVNSTSGSTAESQTFSVIAGTTYYVRVHSFSASSAAWGSFTVCVTNLPPVNDDCSGADNLFIGTDQCTAPSTTGNTQFASTSTSVPAATCDASTDMKDVWYKLTTASNSLLNIEINNGTGTIVAQLFSGSCGSLTEIACATGASGANITNFAATANTTYYVRVYSAGGTSSFKIKAYQNLVAGVVDFQNAMYFTATGNTLSASNQSLAAFNYSSANPAHPLLNNGVYYAITDLTGKNLWLRVRHTAADPNGPGIGYNITATSNSPFYSGGFGGWGGFLYQFDVYQDLNIAGCRANTLSVLQPVNIVMESIETLSQAEWLLFENLNPESSNWILNSINFTGNNPGSNPGFSATNIPYPSPFPGGFSSTFPPASKNIYAIDLGGESYAEFKMSANNVSQFKYGYEFVSSGGYQGIRLSFGTATVLPLRLLHFDAVKNTATVQLNWQTTNEINTSHFIVQHSINGTTFNNIGRVEARNTSGNNDYSLTDASPVDGANFYRLQMVDIDGKTTYSSIIKIVFGSKNEMQVFPNPAKNTITLSGLENKGTIKIIAADGKLVKQLSAKAGNMQVDISTLAKGIYILQYNNEAKTEQVKIIKQ